MEKVSFVVLVILAIIVISKFMRSIRLVPTKKEFLVERLGKYSRTLKAGFHIMLPFFDKVAFIQDLKEETINVDPQECFTKDNVQVVVDGVIYISVADSLKASYGIVNYRFGAIQLAQTTTRSIIGTLELDRTFEERSLISAKVVEVLSEAGENWGITVHRYEIKNIAPPSTVKNSMEKQVTAERDKRATIARSEGEMQAKINDSEGMKTEIINLSEGEMQKSINEAEGRASEIEAIAIATAESIEKMAAAISENKGEEAITMRLSQRYLDKLSSLGSKHTDVILPADITNMSNLLKGLGLKDL